MSSPVLKADPEFCMKCGFCMSACPVYNIDKIESHVARGRNVLVQMTQNSNLRLGDSYEEALYYCLLCGKCEAVCPAKISSTAITMNARSDLVKKKGLSWFKRIIYRGLLGHRTLIAGLAKIAAYLPGFSVKEGKAFRHFPDLITKFIRGFSVPSFSVPFLSKRIPQKTPAAVKVPRGKVAVFAGCLIEFFYAGVGKDMITALAEAGYEVYYPPGQTCCGLPVYSAGDSATARSMAIQNMEALDGFDYIIIGCASCGSTLKGYSNWFDEDDPLKKQADAFSDKVRDFTEFLSIEDMVTLKPGNTPVKVTYHDPCHLKWKQGISKEPRDILKSFDGVTFIEMEGADNCCGLGGSFAIMHPDTSREIQSQKIESIRKTGAEIVVTSCPGCMMQLMDGIRRKNLPVKVMHISQFMHKDY